MKSILHLIATVTIFQLLPIHTSDAETILISEGIRNGNFESQDTISPWIANRIDWKHVKTDSVNESNERTHLEIQSISNDKWKTAIGRLIQRNLPSTSSEGNTYKIKIHATKSSNSSFDRISATITLHHGEKNKTALGSYKLIDQELPSNEDITLEGQAHVSQEDWDSITLRIDFSKRNKNPEDTYKAYINSVYLSQSDTSEI